MYAWYGASQSQAVTYYAVLLYRDIFLAVRHSEKICNFDKNGRNVAQYDKATVVLCWCNIKPRAPTPVRTLF